MSDSQPTTLTELEKRLPPLWQDSSLRTQIASRVHATNRCVVALDDDPTGTQTVHDIWVVTDWSKRNLRKILADGEPALYILTNSRSMPLAKAQEINRAIASNLVAAAREEGRPISVVSRSDSTLRGHYPGELDALEAGLMSAGMPPFDGTCIIPFFAEGGRLTARDIHWVKENDHLIPAALTPYAQDPVFGYRHSHLRLWIEEKTEGRIKASDVVSISLEVLRTSGPLGVAQQLESIENGQAVVVNALDYRDLEVFVRGLLEVEQIGKRFLFRTAASFVRVAAGIADKPLINPEQLIAESTSHGGLTVVGSHVPKSTAQLNALRQLTGVEAVEFSVPTLLSTDTPEQLISQLSDQLNAAISRGRDVVLFTSRELVVGSTNADTLSIGKRVSESLVEIVKQINHMPSYVIAKGGITSSDLATEALNIRAARVLGQIYPGVPVWELGQESRWPGVAYIVFPGNVGEEETIAEIVEALRR